MRKTIGGYVCGGALCITLMIGIASMLNADQVAQQPSGGSTSQMSGAIRYKYSGHVDREDLNPIAGLAEAGRRGDRSQIPSIIRILSAPPHPVYVFNGLHALARLGATEALPVFDAYIPQTIMQNADTDISNFAIAARARLLAESEARGINDPKARAAVKVKRFYSELSLTSAALNAAPLTYTKPQYVNVFNSRENQPQGTRILQNGQPITSIATYTLRELSDMVYQDGYKDYAALPDVARVDFSRDYPSALKIRLASLPHPQRLSTIIEELANKKFLRSEDSYEIQLAIAEGVPAGRAAASKLKEMDKRRDQYTSPGFSALFGVLDGVGDKEQRPVIEYFMHDANRSVAHFAKNVFFDVRDGIKGERRAAY